MYTIKAPPTTASRAEKNVLHINERCLCDNATQNKEDTNEVSSQLVLCLCPECNKYNILMLSCLIKETYAQCTCMWNLVMQWLSHGNMLHK